MVYLLVLQFLLMKYGAFECVLQNEEAFQHRGQLPRSANPLLFIRFEGACVSFIFMNPSLPANKSSRHRHVSISLEVIQGTIINHTQRHNLFTPPLIDA